MTQAFEAAFFVVAFACFVLIIMLWLRNAGMNTKFYNILSTVLITICTVSLIVACTLWPCQ